MNLTEIITILKNHNYKITEQRRAILQILSNHNHHGLLSVERLYQETLKLYPKTNMSTVYRNLEILESLDLLYKIVNDNGATSYKLICCNEHHHHIICNNCGKTEVIDFCPIDTLKLLANEKHFQLTAHKIELYGYCHECSSKLNND